MIKFRLKTNANILRKKNRSQIINYDIIKLLMLSYLREKRIPHVFCAINFCSYKKVMVYAKKCKISRKNYQTICICHRLVYRIRVSSEKGKNKSPNFTFLLAREKMREFLRKCFFLIFEKIK